ncbi:hypothetical protein [Haloferula sargassicola]|uniref:hypothetical protein n=1 Tax=Haloferula sargassicola TaxID=490096 RepID=UPI0033657551
MKKYIPIKLCFVPFFLSMASLLIAGDDPFTTDTRSPGQPVAWEDLIVHGIKYDKKNIYIDGFFCVKDTGDGEFSYFIYSDLESLKNDRPFKYIKLDKAGFDSEFFRKKTNGRTRLKLNGAYVWAMGEFVRCARSEESCVGKIVPPCSLQFQNENGVVRVIHVPLPK